MLPNRIFYTPLVFLILPFFLSSCFFNGFIDETGPVRTIPEGVKKWISVYVNDPQLEFENLLGEKQLVRVNYHREVIKGGNLPAQEYIYVIIKDANNNTILRIGTNDDNSAFGLSADDEYGTVEVNDKGEVIKSTSFIETLSAIELHNIRYENLIHFKAPNGVEFYYSQNEGLVNFTVWRYGKMTEWFKI